MLVPVRTVAPTAALISLSEAKLHCRVDHTADDSLVTALIAAATDYLDGYSGILGRALITQTWQMDFASFDDPMRLRLGNLIAVTGVTYYDSSNSQQTLSSSVYAALSDGIGPYLTLKSGQAWPSIYTRNDAVRVTWTAGYGAAASNVPVPIQQAALLLIGQWYDNRAASAAGVTSQVPFAVDALVSPFCKTTF